MNPIKRAYYIALGSYFVIFQRRKQIVIDLFKLNQTIFIYFILQK
jgi:hypothetical protein